VLEPTGSEDFDALAEQEQDVADLIDAARGRSDYGAMERLTKTRIELRRAMAALRPAPATDPDTDIANVEAARLLVARIRKMVERKRSGMPNASPK